MHLSRLPGMLCSSLPCWSSPQSGETSVMQSQAEKSLPPNRQQLNNRKNARNVRQNVSRLSTKISQTHSPADNKAAFGSNYFIQKLSLNQRYSFFKTVDYDSSLTNNCTRLVIAFTKRLRAGNVRDVFSC